MNAPVILLLAGEPSGDLHAAQVARAVRARWPRARMLGTGGPRMEAEGVELVAHLDDLAVMGFVEVLSRLPYFWRLERQIRRILQSESVDLVIPVDYPGFNLRITDLAHSEGIPVVYYIAPQVWAWKAGRTGRLARAADRIAVILPFEEEIFRREGGKAVFVGHPLLEQEGEDASRDVFCNRHALDPDRPLLALFPGSRSQEIHRHLEPFLGAGDLLRKERPDLQIAVARANSLQIELPLGSSATLVPDGVGLLRHARAALVKSGTTTLEAALAGVPFAVAYRTHPLTFFLAQRLVRVEHVALANLVAESRVVPEFLQDDVTPSRLAAAMKPLLEDTEERRRVIEGLNQVRAKLGRPGAAGRVVSLADDVLRGRNG